MKKRFFSILLSLCMVLMLFPVTVFAEGEEGNATELQNLLDEAEIGGTVTLDRNYTIDTTLNVNKTVTLDLNGHVIKMTGSGSVINVGSNGNLTLRDSSVAKSGVITGGNASSKGGGVYISNGSFTMNGGTIEKCYAKYGGGVCIDSGSFTMNGGAIKGCRASDQGGGVYTIRNITMSGGTIENCSASSGGGVYTSEQSFTMNDGTIENCSASSGGGVFVNHSGNFTMSGGAIENCSASSKSGGGGGVNVDNKGNFTMNGGAIENCSAEYGGGVRVVVSGSSFTSNGGIVKDTVFIGDVTSLKTTSSGSYTTFYSEVKYMGTISGGVYYGGINNRGGQVIGTYHTVSFNSNGGSSVPTQWFVNTSTAKALQPVTNPTKEGYTFAGWYTDETLTYQYNFEEAVTRDITLYARFEPRAYTITYNGGEGSTGSIAEGTKIHGVPFTLSSDTFTREGYVQTGWMDEEGERYNLGGTYTTNENVTMYPVWDEIIEIPFTTTVKQGGNVAPGKTVFNLQLVDYQGNDLSSEDVKVTASITTNGAGSYEGTMTITGPSEDLPDMLSDGVFVQQVNAGEEGWSYDDKVWGLRYYNKEIALAYDDEILPPSSVLIFPATLVTSDNGSYYEIPDDAYAVPQMSFTNTYTKSIAKTTDSNSKNGTTTNVQTGDNSNFALWFVLFAVSAAGVIATGVYSRRRRSS
ncbi:InlB B-repeat-containing protein [Bariatricus sp. SGI.161]|uniref:InlB B-repeat-containing protein n=1 Tax=Bariatricus sp. SGI.161 TaxID=3420550 RepID=UPI003CFEC014